MPRNEHAQPGQDFSEHAWDESYTLPENQFQAWHLTGDRRHLELGRRFLYDEFFAALARGDNVLPGKHAYSHVNGLSSAVQAYLSLGTPMYLAAAQHGFEMIDAQSFATGGWGPDEHFVVPDSGALGRSLTDMNKSFETPCGAYAHFKLTRYLLRITREARYGDSMERVLYNTVLGAIPIQPDGHAFYYSDYTRNAKKTFHPDRWPCCSGTLPMIAADYAISSCFTDPQGIYVNLYVPAQVKWSQNGASCGLSIETDYPYAPSVIMTLRLPSALNFALNLRIPGWAQGASLSINGSRDSRPLPPGSFAAIRREWRSADRIELELPLMRRLELSDPSADLICGGGIHAFGSKALNVDQAHHLGVGVPLRSPSGHRLDGLMSITKRKLDMASRCIPFYADHSGGHLLARRLFTAIDRHRHFDRDFQPEQCLRDAIVRLRWNKSRICAGQCSYVPIVYRAFLGKLAVRAACPDDDAVGHFVAERGQHVVGSAQHHNAIPHEAARRRL